MVIADPVNRFERSVNNQSLSLASDLTTYSDFGDGGLGCTYDNEMGGIGNFLNLDFNWQTIALAGLGGWVLWRMMKGGRVGQEIAERQIYRNKVKRAREEYKGRRKRLKAEKPLFAFA